MDIMCTDHTGLPPTSIMPIGILGLLMSSLSVYMVRMPVWNMRFVYLHRSLRNGYNKLGV